MVRSCGWVLNIRVIWLYLHFENILLYLALCEKLIGRRGQNGVGGGCRWIRRLEKDPWWEMLLAWTKEVVVKTDWKVQREFAMVENDRGTESDLELYNIKHRKYSDTSIWRNKHWKMAISRYGRDLNYSTYRLVILFRYLKYRYSALWVWNPEERSGMKICILKS